MNNEEIVKGMRMQNPESAPSTSFISTLDKKLMSKIVTENKYKPNWAIYLLGVAATALIAFAIYTQATRTAPQQLQAIPTTSATASPTPVESSPIIVDAYEGWSTYDSKRFGIKFRYPAEWTIKETADGPSVYMKQRDLVGSEPESEVAIVNFLKKIDYSFNDPLPDVKGDPSEVIIMGKKYKFLKVGFGEGFGPQSGGYLVYYTRIENKWYASIVSTFGEFNPEGCNYFEGEEKSQCEHGRPYKYQTQQEDIAKALKVVSSLRF